MHRERAQRVRYAATAAVAALFCGGLFDGAGFEMYIPYVPTPDHIVERMLELAEVGPDDYLIDLGSGDGRIPITAAKKYGTRGLGVDIEPRLVRLANENAVKAGVADKVRFIEQDLFDTKIGDATVVALYLPPAVNMRLRPRLLAELRPGSRIVSHAFSMGGWLADRRESVRGIDVYLWIVPARVSGIWEAKLGDRRLTLKIDQFYQEVIGSAELDGRNIPMLDPKLRGNQLDFSLQLDAAGPTRFHGRLDGDTIRAASEAPAWSARRVSQPAAK